MARAFEYKILTLTIEENIFVFGANIFLLCTNVHTKHQLLFILQLQLQKKITEITGGNKLLFSSKLNKMENFEQSYKCKKFAIYTTAAAVATQCNNLIQKHHICNFAILYLFLCMGCG